jgi:diguanylate cyclase (GGDEF)-like protein
MQPLRIPKQGLFYFLLVSVFCLSWFLIQRHELNQLKRETVRASSALMVRISKQIMTDVAAISMLDDRMSIQSKDPLYKVYYRDLYEYFKKLRAVESVQISFPETGDSTILKNPYTLHDRPITSKKECDKILHSHLERSQRYHQMTLVPLAGNLCLYNASHSMMVVLSVRSIIARTMKEEMAKGYFILDFEGISAATPTNAGNQTINFWGTSWTYTIYPSQAYLEVYRKKSLLMALFLVSVLFGVMFLMKPVRHYFFTPSRKGESSDLNYLRKLAFFDPLTELPNREGLLRHLAMVINRANRYPLNFSLCFIDCDDFKQINDKHGHHFGDQVLKHIADVVKGQIRKNDFLARLAGDEFCLILEDATTEPALNIVLTKLLQAIAAPVIIDGQRLQCSVSIGVAVYPESGKTAEELLIYADKMMYQAKRNKKGSYQ